MGSLALRTELRPRSIAVAKLDPVPGVYLVNVGKLV